MKKIIGGAAAVAMLGILLALAAVFVLAVARWLNSILAAVQFWVFLLSVFGLVADALFRPVAQGGRGRLAVGVGFLGGTSLVSGGSLRASVTRGLLLFCN